jgi:hypothetical protein
MSAEITLVDRGRGLQLSTSRITVLDLVPYFQQGCSAAEIMRWLPTLSAAEIGVVEGYYRQNKEELDEEDQRVRQYREEQMRQQALRFSQPEETPEERIARLRGLLHQRLEGKNGEGNPR